MLFFGGSGSIFIAIGFLMEMFLGIYFLFTGEFTPYKFIGFIGFGLLLFGFILIVIGLIAGMVNRVRVNQENMLYELKKERYDD